MTLEVVDILIKIFYNLSHLLKFLYIFKNFFTSNDWQFGSILCQLSRKIILDIDKSIIFLFGVKWIPSWLSNLFFKRVVFKILHGVFPEVIHSERVSSSG